MIYLFLLFILAIILFLNKKQTHLFLAFLSITLLLSGCESELKYKDDEMNDAKNVTPIEDKIVEKKEEENVETKVDENLRLSFIDIGQGDATLIELPNGEVALIDGGPGKNRQKLIDYIDSRNIKKIDYIIATHPHEDHIGGLPDVIDKYDIGSIYMPNIAHNTKIFERLLKSIKRNNLKIKVADEDLSIIDIDELKFEILSPKKSYKTNKLNNYSVVTKLKFKNNSFLFTGDAEKEIERDLISKDIEVDLLKSGHHGSTTSNTREFIDRVNPKLAVISCGKNNDYGHPHKEVINMFNNKDITTFRTDNDGDVVIVSDGEKLKRIMNNGDINKNDLVEKKSNPIEKTKESYIGNINTKKFHKNTCQSLDRTNPKNKINLKDRDKAIIDGYKPCQICNP